MLYVTKGVRVGADDANACMSVRSECPSVSVSVQECLCMLSGISLVKTNHHGRPLRCGFRRGVNTVNTEFWRTAATQKKANIIGLTGLASVPD